MVNMEESSQKLKWMILIYIVLKGLLVKTKVMVFLNFSESNKTINLNETQSQPLTELFSKEQVENLSKVELGPLAYKVFYTK